MSFYAKFLARLEVAEKFVCGWVGSKWRLCLTSLSGVELLLGFNNMIISNDF